MYQRLRNCLVQAQKDQADTTSQRRFALFYFEDYCANSIALIWTVRRNPPGLVWVSTLHCGQSQSQFSCPLVIVSTPL